MTQTRNHVDGMAIISDKDLSHYQQCRVCNGEGCTFCGLKGYYNTKGYEEIIDNFVKAGDHV